jgi:protein ImuA
VAGSKGDIIRQLQQEILHLSGYRPALIDQANPALGPINQAFPGQRFPTGAVHEFLCSNAESVSASSGFIAGILSTLMQKGGTSIWINSVIFPPALKSFGIEPDKILFINLKKSKEILWVMEEALRCDGLSAVICEIKEIGFTESRRLQLAVEQSGVTGFVLKAGLKNKLSSSVARWRIGHLPSDKTTGLPGPGFPRWQVELLKIRNGQPGNWQIEWRAGRFRPVYQPLIVTVEEQRKAG